MKKITISLLLLLSLLNATELTKEETKRINKLYSIENKDNFKNLKEEFEKVTGDKNFDKYFKEAVKDENWKKANFYLREKKEKKKVMFKHELKEFNTPEYEQALELFLLSAKKGNIISAYQGFALIEKVFLYMEDNKIVKIYLKEFANELMKKNYCIGYLYKGKSLKYDTFNYNENYELMKKGLTECYEKDKIPQYYIEGLKHQIIYFKTMNNVEKHKEEEKNKKEQKK